MCHRYPALAEGPPPPDGWLQQVVGIDVVRTVAADLWTERHQPPTDPDDEYGGPDRTWFERYPGS